MADKTINTTSQTGDGEWVKERLISALLESERGLCAIHPTTGADVHSSIAENMAFSGIDYVATTLERDVRAILNPLEASAAAGGAV